MRLPNETELSRKGGRRPCGRYSVRSLPQQRPEPGFPDLAIAATAVTHQLTVLTGNLRHFAPLGIAAYNPLDALPKD
jgi:predicted nucleic acid-binding protein